MPLLPTDLITEKKQLRAHFLKIRQTRSPEQKEQIDRALRDAVTALPEFQACTRLLCYAPTRGEIDLMPLGTGDLPIPELVANIPDRISHIIVELDYCNVEMLEALKRSYEYMTSNGLAVGSK